MDGEPLFQPGLGLIRTHEFHRAKHRSGPRTRVGPRASKRRCTACCVFLACSISKGTEPPELAVFIVLLHLTVPLEIPEHPQSTRAESCAKRVPRRRNLRSMIT